MFSTREVGGWRGWLLTEEDEGMGVLLVEVVRMALERVEMEMMMGKGGKKKASFRAFDHRPLGRANSPILVTVSRIK